jgi:hypothetical protein
MREIHHIKDLGVGGGTILKWILIGYAVVVWNDQALNRERWWSVVNTIMNFRVT